MEVVNIITPSFNQAQFLEETIQSVIHQDYPHIEYIIIDGGSTDGSVDIIRRYEKYVAYWVSEPDKGQSNAINKGFAHAKGSIFAWLNSDDLLAPSAVRIAVHYLTREPEIGLVYGDRLHIDTKGNVVGINRCPPHDINMFRKNFTLPQETVFFRREVFEKVGGIDENLKFSMDFDLWCKMNQVTKMCHIPAFMGCFREHEAAKSITFHDSQNAAYKEYREEHAKVYYKHFKKRLPSPTQMKYHRIKRQLSVLFQQRSKRYQEEIGHIRKIIEDK